MGGEIDEGRHIGLVRKAALAGSPISFFGAGVAISRLLVLPRGAVEREGTSQKTTSRNEFSYFVYQHDHNHGFLEDSL
jgi:hypothetical protein